MVEGVNLVAMTETPLVIVVAQRPGPATGLATRREQADLEFVLYAGHGEFPRAIFIVGTAEECFYLTRRSFELAERYQGPMFFLTDQFLADSSRTVTPERNGEYLLFIPFSLLLEDRLLVGQWTLDPLTGVRILLPQPSYF